MEAIKPEQENKLKSKLSRTWIEETKNSGEVFRLYFTKRQRDKIIQIVRDVLQDDISIVKKG